MRSQTQIQRLRYAVLASLVLQSSLVVAESPPPFVCEFEAREQIGEIDADNPPGLNEASGLVQSRRNPNVFWSHQDNWNDERIFAIHRNGTYLGTWDLDVTTARDPEDIAIGPGPIPGEHYIFYGDVGHNTGVWGEESGRDLRVWRAVEPIVDPDQAFAAVASYPADLITLKFPDAQMLGQRQDVEGLMVDPLSGDLYIVTKRSTPGMVFRAPFPHSTTEPIVMEWVADLPFGGDSQATGADISADGRLIIVRRYWDGYVWERAPGQSVGAAMAGSYCHVTGLSETQGEAITFDTNNTGTFYTTSEGTGMIPVHRIGRTVGECQDDADCDDDLFCNGSEQCGADLSCQTGSTPSCSQQLCSEALDACVDCLSDGDCPAGDVCDMDTGTCQIIPGPEPLPVLPGDTWRYWKGSVAPPGGWATPGFDDLDWLTGSGGFGYGSDCSGYIGTTLADMQGSYASVYLRHTFDVPDPSAVAALAFTVDFDDSFVAYLNGVEIARANVVGSPPTHVQLATTNHECSQGSPDPNPAATLFVDADLLLPGPNTLGVEGHNLTLGSSDFSLIVGLAASAVECTSNADCDDGLFCNGSETCDEQGSCQQGSVPCLNDACDESANQCTECGLPETCNGIDDDCNGLVDDGPEGADPDLDGVPSACDNCPTVGNPGQGDMDADGEGDVCDGDDGQLSVSFAQLDVVDWDAETMFDGWNLYQGNLAALRAGGGYTQTPAEPLADRQCGLSGPAAAVEMPLAPSDIVFLLVAGTASGVESGIGMDSEGLARPITDPCP